MRNPTDCAPNPHSKHAVPRVCRHATALSAHAAVTHIHCTHCACNKHHATCNAAVLFRKRGDIHSRHLVWPTCFFPSSLLTSSMAVLFVLAPHTPSRREWGAPRPTVSATSRLLRHQVVYLTSPVCLLRLRALYVSLIEARSCLLFLTPPKREGGFWVLFGSLVRLAF